MKSFDYRIEVNERLDDLKEQPQSNVFRARRLDAMSDYLERSTERRFGCCVDERIDNAEKSANSSAA